MEPMGNDSWVARSPLEENTRYVYTIEAYPDPYRTWAEDLKKRLALAATLSSLYGIYSGYELCENVAIPGPRSIRTRRSTRSRYATGMPPGTSRATSPTST